MTHHTIIPVQLRTDQGHVVDAWRVVGTSIEFAGQAGEALARDAAKRLDEELAAKRRREREGD